MVEGSPLVQHAFVGKGLEKRYDGIDLVIGKGRHAHRLDRSSVEGGDRSDIPSAAIKLDHLSQSKCVAVVKVRRGESYISQRRDLECALHAEAFGNCRTVEIGGRRVRE